MTTSESRLASLRKSKFVELHDERFCEFTSVDWEWAQIDIAALQQLTAGKRHDLATENLTTQLRPHRLVIVGDYAQARLRFFGEDECPTKSSSLLADYEGWLGESFALQRLTQFLIDTGPSTVMSDPGMRFSVEFLSHYAPASADLPPHEDGVGCLFFVALSNSMLGGEMKIWRNVGDVIAPPVRGEAEKAALFDEPKELVLLRSMHCESGQGYFIHERPHLAGCQILHGCSRWSLPASGYGVRVTLRISFQVPRAG
jgi:hypothetical protein